ncbi:MAG: exo-alpha-sialidase [Planctomycetota bacterium]
MTGSGRMVVVGGLLVAATALGGAMGKSAAREPPVRWALDLPKKNRAADGYRPLEGVEHVELFHATPERGTYCHHPHIAHHDGAFYAAWSNHARDEDGPGQRVYYSTSADGRTWRSFRVCFPALGPTKPHGEMGRVLTANGIVAVEDAVYAIAEVHDYFGRGHDEAREAVEARTGRQTRRGRFGWGRLARAIEPDGGLGPAFWLVPDPPAPIGDAPQFPASDDPRHADVAKKINALLADPLHMPAWDFRFHTNWTTAADGHGLCEPSCYRRPDGAVVKLSRDLEQSRRIYATVSRDGRSFPPAVRTSIPDAPSKAVSGTLPDGRIYLVGNQTFGRDPLVISLSTDGVVFDRATSIRHGAPAIRHRGRAKGRGFQYPSIVVAEGALWVIYSVGKEDVAVSHVPLAALARQADP